MPAADAHGPIDTVVIEFPAGTAGAATADEIARVVDAGTVALYDVMVVANDADGRCTEVDLTDPSAHELSAFARFADWRTDLLGDEDVEVAVEFRDGLGEAVAPVIAGSITSVKVDGDEVTYEAQDVADIAGIAALTVHASGVSGPRTVIVHVRD